MNPNPNSSDFSELVAQNVVKFQNGYYRRKLRIFTMNIVRTATVGQSFTGNFQTDPGLPFILTKLSADDTADPNGAGATTGMENWSVQIQDSESQYLWCSGSVGRIQLFGGREFGYQLPTEMLLRAQTQVNATVTNRAAGATAGTATLCFIGYALLPMASTSQF